MTIRMATNADIPGLIRLLLQVGQVHHDIRPDIFRPGTQKYNEQDLMELLRDESRPVFVAVEDAFVKGYCFCIHREYRGGGVFVDRQELYVDDLCVDESCRGQGIATKLYDHVCAYARGQGCAFITLNVWSGNDGAMKFYEKAGMRPRSITMDMPLEDPSC